MGKQVLSHLPFNVCEQLCSVVLETFWLYQQHLLYLTWSRCCNDLWAALLAKLHAGDWVVLELRNLLTPSDSASSCGCPPCCLWRGAGKWKHSSWRGKEILCGRQCEKVVWQSQRHGEKFMWVKAAEPLLRWSFDLCSTNFQYWVSKNKPFCNFLCTAEALNLAI